MAGLRVIDEAVALADASLRAGAPSNFTGSAMNCCCSQPGAEAENQADAEFGGCDWKLPRPREQGCPSFAQALRAPDFKRHAACGQRGAQRSCADLQLVQRGLGNTRSRGSSQVAGETCDQVDALTTRSGFGQDRSISQADFGGQRATKAEPTGLDHRAKADNLQTRHFYCGSQAAVNAGAAHRLLYLPQPTSQWLERCSAWGHEQT